MEWIIKIDGEDKKKRVLVRFNALENELKIIGQYKINMKWEDFSILYSPTRIDQENLMTLIEVAVERMNERVNDFENLQTNFFNVVKIIEYVKPAYNT